MTNDKEKDLAYYLTLYKIEGHQTWRASLSQKKDGFELQIKNQNAGKFPKVTEKMVMRIDRLTGGFSEVK